ncbi:MAG: YbaN family protein, partial [Ilumatobacteraceae bacterium]
LVACGGMRAIRWLWFGLGWLAVAVGSIGIVVPGLPTTVFFVAAAACFSRSSPRFEQWVLTRPGIGPMVRDYRAGLGMPRRAKVAAITCIVVVCSISAGLLVDAWWLRITIAALGLVGVAWIAWRIPTRAPAPPPDDDRR